MYHLTDSPSFLTNGDEVGDVLCAFDPHCRFVPGATPNEPGRMFDDLDEMKTVFTDVFQAYLTNMFDLRGGTMFRYVRPDVSARWDCSGLYQDHMSVFGLACLMDSSDLLR